MKPSHKTLLPAVEKIKIHWFISEYYCSLFCFVCLLWKLIFNNNNNTQKEYKVRHYWVSKVIHWEMCRKFQFDHTNKWYMHNPAPVLENDMHKLLWDFNIQTDHLILVRRLDLIVINKKKRSICKIVDFAVMNGQNTEKNPGDLRSLAVT